MPPRPPDSAALSPKQLRERSQALLRYARRVREDADGARERSARLKEHAAAAKVSAGGHPAHAEAACKRLPAD
jgi:hypothetical protein